MNKLYAAKYFGDPDGDWWAIPQVLNFYHCPLTNYRDLRLVEQHPALLYLTLRTWAKAKPAAIQQAGRHFWHSLSYAQRHQPLSRELGQRMVRAFRAGDADLVGMVDKERLNTLFYWEGNTVKAIKRGGFSYNDDDGSGELEYWTTVECGNCSHEANIREQLGKDTVAEFVTTNAGDLEDKGLRHVSGPYCACDECETISRVKVYPAPDLPSEAYEDLGDDDAWDCYKDHLGELIQELTAHLVAHGLPKPDGLRLEIGNADWRGRDAWAECALDGEALADKMRVNSEFTISGGELLCFPTGNAELRCRLSHHDVPTGSPVSILPYWECELSYQGEDHLSFEELRESREGLAKLAETLLAGPGGEFEHSEGTTFAAVRRDSLIGGVEWLMTQCELKDPTNLEGYSLAVHLLLTGLLDDLNAKVKVSPARAEQVRAVLDHWLEHSTEEECS